MPRAGAVVSARNKPKFPPWAIVFCWAEMVSQQAVQLSNPFAETLTPPKATSSSSSDNGAPYKFRNWHCPVTFELRHRRRQQTEESASQSQQNSRVCKRKIKALPRSNGNVLQKLAPLSRGLGFYINPKQIQAYTIQRSHDNSCIACEDWTASKQTATDLLSNSSMSNMCTVLNNVLCEFVLPVSDTEGIVCMTPHGMECVSLIQVLRVLLIQSVLYASTEFVWSSIRTEDHVAVPVEVTRIYENLHPICFPFPFPFESVINMSSKFRG